MRCWRRRLLSFAAAVSLLICLIATFLWWASYQPTLSRSELHAIEQGAALIPGMVDWGSRDGKVMLLRVSRYDPRSTLGSWSMLGIRVERRISTPYHARRRFETLEISYAWPVCVSVVVSVLVFRLRHSKARQPGLCATCGYDLRATPEKCPECGKAPAH